MDANNDRLTLGVVLESQEPLVVVGDRGAFEWTYDESGNAIEEAQDRLRRQQAASKSKMAQDITLLLLRVWLLARRLEDAGLESVVMRTYGIQVSGLEDAVLQIMSNRCDSRALAQAEDTVLAAWEKAKVDDDASILLSRFLEMLLSTVSGKPAACVTDEEMLLSRVEQSFMADPLRYTIWRRLVQAEKKKLGTWLPILEQLA